MKFFTFIFCLFYIQFSHSYINSSDVFCTHRDNPADWKWAPANPDGLDRFKNIAPPNNERLQLMGTGFYNEHSSFLVRSFSLLRHEAKELCYELRKKCMDEYGSKYSHIGVAGRAAPSFLWTHIYVPYLCDEHSGQVEYIVCPNWSYTFMEERE